MKTITIYELLGLVKDGNLPKTIKFNNIYCYYRECKNEYVDFTNKPIIQWDYVVMNSLNDEVEIIEEKNEIHANNIEFNLNDNKRDCVITLDENSLGIDKLNLKNCYFYEENGKWYVKNYDLKYIDSEEEKKIPEKIEIDNEDRIQALSTGNFVYKVNQPTKNIIYKINEIIDYLKNKGDE